MQYRDYLKTDIWKNQKSKAKYWHGNKCVICGLRIIDIHHKTYKNGLGNENAKYHLIPLCREHHFFIHNFSNENKISIYQATEKILKQWKKLKNIAGNILGKKHIKKEWETMTHFEREKYVGKII